ncbi:hypothetical protein FQN54_006253 [Arachnomyces sp. PD_36]|nr:hypothetical protein FQN54_006253 [Arachnomyces sp. PD_36]
MDEQPQNLQALFVAAKNKKKAVESSTEPNSDSYRELVSSAIKRFEECQRFISQLSLFSDNESLDDISTGDLQYITVDYLLAELVQRSHSSDREAVLRRAQVEYDRYLDTLDTYGLLSPGDKKLYQRYTNDPSSFHLASMNDAAARRHTKVARFREEKELKQKLEDRILIRRQYLSKNQNLLQNDDDATRQIYLAEINLYTHQTFQSLDILSQEITMLETIRKSSHTQELTHEDDTRSREREKGGYSDRLDGSMSELLKNAGSGPLLSKDGKPLQIFTLTDKRSQFQKGVFRSGHNLPTMSIDEYLEEEKRRGGVVQGGEQSGIAPEIDEDDMDKADEETEKARAWDEFTENNPKGSGNTLNRG